MGLTHVSTKTGQDQWVDDSGLFCAASFSFVSAFEQYEIWEQRIILKVLYGIGFTFRKNNALILI